MAQTAGDAAKVGAAGAAVGGGAALVAQGAVGASIPTLQATFGTVVAGVGTIQPAWMGSVAAFSATPLVGFALPAALVVGGVAAVGYIAHKNRA